jgi:hypothetical protein
MGLDYRIKLRELEAQGREEVGRLGVSPKPERFAHIPYRVLGVDFYMGEDAGSGEYGRFPEKDIPGILEDAGMADLEALHNAQLDVLVKVRNRNLWGFRFRKNSKLWIPEYEPRQLLL